MKSKTALLATAASFALFGAAYGQTPIVIDITGSTAGRSTVTSQIASLLTGESTAWYVVNNDPKSIGSADAAIFKGGTLLVNGVQVPVTVRTFWAGSASGVNYVSNGVKLDNKFIDISVDTTANLQLNGTQAQLQAQGKLAPESTETVAEFGFSDVKQAATPYQSSPLAEQTDMFVLPFKWVRTFTFAEDTFDNITDQMVRAAYTAGGETRKSLFTGLAADKDTYVYSVGRDADSGTRITALAETGAGAFAELTQWDFPNPTGSGANVELGNPREIFNGGYASGGSLVSVLGGTGSIAIGYLGATDAASAVGVGGVELKFNGVPFSNANIMNGKYTFWSKYQAIRKLNLGTNTAPAVLFSSLKTALINLPTQGNSSSIKLTDMQVTRQADGADVLTK